MRPITASDVRPVADFLDAHMGGQVSADAWAAAIRVPWKVDAPNHGFMLVAGAGAGAGADADADADVDGVADAEREGDLAAGDVVGVYLAFYADRTIGDRHERFCNLGAWCVLPDYRLMSMRLLTALLAQEGYTFTDLSPSERVSALNARKGFEALDTSGALVPSLPWLPWPGRLTISSSPEVIEETLTGTDLDIYRDHADLAAAHHAIVLAVDDACYVMFRRDRLRSWLPAATVLYVSNPALFRWAAVPLARHLRRRHGVRALFAEARVAPERPRLAARVRFTSRRKMYRSATLGAHDIDDLYSELTCVDW